jgi:hypothetical protein
MKNDPTKHRGRQIVERRIKFLLAFPSVTVEGVKNTVLAPKKNIQDENITLNESYQLDWCSLEICSPN